MARIEVDERRTDRGKHLVDLLAEGTGQSDRQPVAPIHEAATVSRVPWLIGSASVVLLAIALITVLVR